MSRIEILERMRAARPIIAPSMLMCDYGNLAREVERLTAANAKVLHWDVMDGHFVPNLSYGPMVIKRVRPLTDMIFDTHLMISDPDQYLNEYLDAGCDAISFHLEAVPQPTALLRRIRDAGRVAGLVLNPKTPLSDVAPFVGEIDLLLIMSVQAGRGGQSFIPESVEKLRQARRMISPDAILSVDGGIGPKTIAACADAGTNLFVVGSAIFGQSDYGNAVQELVRLAGR